MKINLKFKAMSVLISGLQDTQKWVIYQMASGKDMPDSVTKMDLIKIIAFLFKHLDWIEGTRDTTVELESAANVDTQVNNVTQDRGNESKKPMTSKSLGSDNQEMCSSGDDDASNVSELNEIVNEETETQHFRIETDVDRELEPMEQKSLLW